MYVDAKLTVWHRIKLNEDEGVTKEDVINIIEGKGVDELFNIEVLVPDWDTLVETEDYVLPEDNSGLATVELYDDEGNLLWDNSKPIEED